MTPLATALLWLLLSLIAAPLVGRAIRLGHDRDACRTCQAVRAARAARAPIPVLYGAYQRPAGEPSSPWRCLVCPGAPVVDDPLTHSRLRHRPRPLAVEDRADWSTR